MQLPEELQSALDALLSGADLLSLRRGREEVTAAYRSGLDSARAFKSRDQLLSYLIARMPATFAVCVKVFKEIKKRAPDLVCRSFADLGAGPGSASWAALEVFPEIQQLRLFEREKMAIEVGKQLAKGLATWNSALWIEKSLDQPFDLAPSDVAVFSYVLGEMGVEKSLEVLERVWSAQTRILVIIEPGTPVGYQRIMAVRDWAIKLGAVILAPCPHLFQCPMKEGDWCHFPARVERSRLHKQVKGGTLGYEDEKYSYIVLSKSPIIPCDGRVVGHVHKGSGHVKIPLCTKGGSLELLTVTRSDKKFYKGARHLDWGDGWM